MDPLPYMTYQPFLPEVASGSIEARHAVVNHRQHLQDTELITGRVTSIDHAAKKAVITPAAGEAFEVDYRDVVVAAGAITRTFPIPGLAEAGIGLKTIEEAVELRNKVLERIETASQLPAGAERTRALTFVVVGGGFAGIEAMTEIEDLGRAAVRKNPRAAPGRPALRPGRGDGPDHARGHRGAGQVGRRAHALPRHRGHAEHLAGQGRGRRAEADQHAGQDPGRDLRGRHPALDRRRAGEPGGAQLPASRWTPRGRIKADADPADHRRGRPDRRRLDCWRRRSRAGPDRRRRPGGFCVPNAQHAIRQAKRLAKNLYAARWGVGSVKEYKHKNLGAVAGFGVNKGVAKIMGIKLKGWPAWMAHRGYHGWPCRPSSARSA